MPQLVLSGSLKGPTGEPAANAEITFTSRRTTDIVLQQTVFTARADAQGDYQIALEYGVFDISVKLDTATVSLAQRVRIDEQTSATTLNQLIIDHQDEPALTPQIIVEFRELTAEARGYRDEAQASAQSASADAAATAADRQEVDDDRAHVDQQRQAVDSKADEVEADRLAAQQARTGSEDARDAGQTARDESRAWATGDGVIDNISGTDRYSSRVEADRAADERQGAEDAATASGENADATAADRVATGEDRGATEQDRQAAEEARDAAQLAGGVYEDTGAGLAGTADGDYFTVPSTEDHQFLMLYRNDADSATYVNDYPSGELLAYGLEAAAANRVIAMLIQLQMRLDYPKLG